MELGFRIGGFMIPERSKPALRGGTGKSLANYLCEKEGRPLLIVASHHEIYINTDNHVAYGFE